MLPWEAYLKGIEDTFTLITFQFMGIIIIHSRMRIWTDFNKTINNPLTSKPA